MNIKLGNKWVLGLIVFFICIVVWAVGYNPKDCSLSDKDAISKALTICNELGVLCTGIPKTTIYKRNIKHIEFDDAKYDIHCISKELLIYSLNENPDISSRGSEQPLNSTMQKNTQNEKINKILEPYTAYFNLKEDSLIDIENKSHREIGNIVFAKYTGDGFRTYLLVHEKSGALVSYRRKSIY